MSRSYSAESGSVEVVPVVVTAAADPTGGAVTFSFVATTVTDAAAFVAGSWSGSYNATTNEATALTPTLPDAAATQELAEGKWQIYCKFIVSSETVVQLVGVLTVT